MNLKNISDQTLLENTEKLVREERELLAKVLHHLREIDRRKLFSALGFKSLFEYAVKKLGYSEDQAGRRIAAMRLLEEIPEIEEKIETGALTLTNVGLAQTLFRAEQKAGTPLPKEKKLEVLAQLENKSKRDAEKLVLTQSGEPTRLIADRVRPVTADKVEIKFIADQNLHNKLERLRGLLAHKHPNLSLAELVDHLAEIALRKLDPLQQGAERSNPPAPAKKQDVKPRLEKSQIGHSDEIRGQQHINVQPNKSRGYISIAIRREVWKRAGGKCEHCGSEYAVQIDHRKPIAKGGSNNLENLRLLCRPCNLRSAIETLGFKSMERYLS